MPIDFPSLPTSGQVYLYNSRSWMYNGTGWQSIAYLTSGSVVSGSLAFNTVFSGNVASGQVGTYHHAAASILSGQIGANVIGSPHILAGSITNASLQNSAVTIAGVSTSLGGSWAAAALTTNSGLLAGTYYPSGALTIGIASGGLVAQMLASGSVLSGSIASGQIGANHLASGTLQSAPATLTSGQVTSGFLGNASVVSGSIASGQIGATHLASGTLQSAPATIQSGQITSGFLGNNSVVSGSIASGQVGTFHHQAASILSGQIGANVIGSPHILAGSIANASLTTSTITIAGLSTSLGGSWAAAALSTSSGLLAGTYYPSGALTIGIASGGITNQMLADGSVTSGDIASGQVSRFHIANTSIFSGHISSSEVGSIHLASGAVTSGKIADNAVVSGSIVSGQIGTFHHQAASILSGQIGANVIGSPHILAGSILNASLQNSAVTIAGVSTSLGGSWAAAALTTSSGLLAGTYYPSGSLIIGVASGGINNLHIASGAVVSGDIGNAAVVSGNIAANIIASPHILAGGITNTSLQNSSITVAGSPTSLGGSWAAAALTTSSGLLAGTYYPSGALTIGVASGGINSVHIASGAVVSGDIGNAAVVSGSVASGQIYGHHFNATGLTAGYVLSTDANGNLSWTAGGAASLNSGSITRFYLASGAVNSGHIGNAAVVSGSVASGQIYGHHLSTTGLTAGYVLSTDANGNLSWIAGGAASIPSGSISRFYLASGAVNSGHIASGAVVSENIASGQVISTKLVSGVILSGHIGNGSVLSGSIGANIIASPHILAGGITNTSLQNSSITVAGSPTALGGSWAAAALTTSSGLLAGTYYPSGALTIGIASGGVSNQLLADNSVTSGKIASGQVLRFQIANSSIFSGHISSSEVGSVHLASGAVTSGKIGDNAVISSNIASGQITTSKVAAGAILSGQIGANVIGTPHILAGSILNASLQNSAVTIAGASTSLGGSWAAAALTTSSGLLAGTYYPSGALTIGVASGGINNQHIASGAVVSGDIGNGAVVSGSIAAGQIGTIHLAAGTAATVAGSSGQIQFNAGGVLGASAAVTFSSGGTHLNVTQQAFNITPLRVTVNSGSTSNILEIYTSGGFAGGFGPTGVLYCSYYTGAGTNTLINANIPDTTMQRSVIIGQSAYSASGQIGELVAIGYGAGALRYGVAVGQSSYAAVNSIALGLNSSVTGSTSLGIGTLSNVAHVNAMGFGSRATSTANGDIIFATELQNPTIRTQRFDGSTNISYLFAGASTWIDSTAATKRSRFTLSTYYTTTAQEAIRIDSASDLARVGIGGAASGRLCVYTGAAANKGLMIQGFTSQSANYLEIQNSAGSSLMYMNGSGLVAIGLDSTGFAGGPIYKFHIDGTASGTTGALSPWPTWTPENQSSHYRRVAHFGDGGNEGTITAGHGTTCAINFGDYYTGRVVLAAYAAGSQSPSDQNTGAGRDMMVMGGSSDNSAGKVGGRLFLQGGAGYPSTGFSGNIGVVSIQPLAGQTGIGTSAPSGTLNVVSTSGSMINTIIRSHSAQTANLTEWQTSSFATIARINASGEFFGLLSSGLVTSGAIASGQVGNNHLTSTISNKVIEGDIQTINAQTGTTYTLALSDAGKLVTLNNGAAIAVTIPLNSSVAFATGTHVDFAQLGAGQVTINGAVGVTLNYTPGNKLRAQYAGASIIKIATDTWMLFGDISA